MGWAKSFDTIPLGQVFEMDLCRCDTHFLDVFGGLFAMDTVLDGNNLHALWGLRGCDTMCLYVEELPVYIGEVSAVASCLHWYDKMRIVGPTG